MNIKLVLDAEESDYKAVVSVSAPSLFGPKPGSVRFSAGSPHRIQVTVPKWKKMGADAFPVLEQCYQDILALAVAHRCESLLIPLLTLKDKDFPKDKDFAIAHREISCFPARGPEVSLCLGSIEDPDIEDLMDRIEQYLDLALADEDDAGMGELPPLPEDNDNDGDDDDFELPELPVDESDDEDAPPEPPMPLFDEDGIELPPPPQLLPEEDDDDLYKAAMEEIARMLAENDGKPLKLHIDEPEPPELPKLF